MMGVAIAAMGVAALVVFKKMVKQYVEVGDMVHKMALRTGFAAETLSELAYAADISGADLTMLEKGVKKMSKTIVDASYGLETYLRVFRSLGVEIDDLLVMKPEEQFLKLGDAIAEMESDTLRTAAAVDIFGRAGTMLVPLFKEGAEGIATLREEAHRLGIIFDEEMAAKAAALKDAQTALTGSVKGLSIAIITDLIPVITSVVDQFTDWFVETRKGAKNWTRALIGFFKIVALGVESLLLAFQGFKFGAFKIGEEITKFFIDLLEPIEAVLASMIIKYPKLVEKFLPPISRAITDLTAVQFSYNDAADETAQKMSEILLMFDKLQKSLDAVGKGFKKSKEGAKDFGTTVIDTVLPGARNMAGILDKAVSEMEDRVYEYQETWQSVFSRVQHDAALFTYSLGSLFNQLSENQTARIDAEYEARKKMIEKSLMSEEAKTKAIEKLEKDIEKKRKIAARSAAKRSKVVALLEAIVNTASAIVEALPNIPLSIAVGIMGAAQTALIAAQPLPSFQRGGRIEGAGIVGERGPELFLPERPGFIVPARETRAMLGRPQVLLQFSPTFYLSTLDPQTARDVVRERIGPELLDMLKAKILLPEFQEALGT